MTLAAVQSTSFSASGSVAPPPSTVDALLASSRTGGVLNTRELAANLQAAGSGQADGGVSLFRAVSDRLGPLDQQRLAADHRGGGSDDAIRVGAAAAQVGLSLIGAPAIGAAVGAGAALAAAAAKPKAPSVEDFKLDGATKQDKVDLKTSVDYLDKTKLGAQVIRQAEKDGVTIHIIHDGNDRALGKEVWWDPKSALTTTKGGVQSPALGLVHELAHTQADPSKPIKPLNNAYDNTEERRVITRIETPIAKQLGEGVRTDHRGGLLDVKDPTYHKPNPTK